MATVSSITAVATTIKHRIHPLTSLQPHEITAASSLIKRNNAGRILTFKIIALKEPKKDAVIAYLEAEHGPGALPRLSRIIYSCFYMEGEHNLYEAHVDVTARVDFGASEAASDISWARDTGGNGFDDRYCNGKRFGER